MADNVAYTPGSGAQIAAREVPYSGDTTKMQVVGLATLTGSDDAKVPADVSEAAPLPVAVYGEMIEAIEAMRFAVAALTKSIGFLLPNAQGFPMMEARQATAANLNATVTGSVSITGTPNIATVTTVANQASVGGLFANDQIPALMHLQADNLRRNITVS
jgi:uncharacterized protein YcbX